MAYIFQAKPSIYDFRQRLAEGKTVNWLASRYHRDMRRGEIVYLWQAGDSNKRGIYGWGEITSQEPFVDSKGAYRVAVQTLRIFDSHLSASSVRSTPGLSDIQLFRNAMGTNFRLTETESQALRELVVSEYGEAAAPPGEG